MRTQFKQKKRPGAFYETKHNNFDSQIKLERKFENHGRCLWNSSDLFFENVQLSILDPLLLMFLEQIV